MFERYTENARRVLFFARYESSQLGDLQITIEHLLLGLGRATTGTAARILRERGISIEDIRQEIARHSAVREKVSTSVEIPFNNETKRVLQFAAEEADGLRHSHIGTEHLLQGVSSRREFQGGYYPHDAWAASGRAARDASQADSERWPLLASYGGVSADSRHQSAARTSRCNHSGERRRTIPRRRDPPACQRPRTADE